MRFFTTLVSGSALVATALAQVNIAFTGVPAAAEVGQEYEITWGGGDEDLPVTITLRKGDPLNLETITTLTNSGTNGSYTWKPEESLEGGEDYALQITQGQFDINYSGPFTVISDSESSSISSSATSTSASSTETDSASNSTITSMSETGMSTGLSMTMTGNSTDNSTLVSETETDTAIETATETETETDSTSTADSESTSRSRTASDSSGPAEETSSAPDSSDSGAARFASSLALVFGVVAAIATLN